MCAEPPAHGSRRVLHTAELLLERLRLGVLAPLATRDGEVKGRGDRVGVPVTQHLPPDRAKAHTCIPGPVMYRSEEVMRETLETATEPTNP